jgi:hypothetical protein
MGKSNINQHISGEKLGKRTYAIFDIFKSERKFLILIFTLLLTAAVVTPYTHIAMWVGFAIAGYSAIANDSIQTIGTFIASNTNRKWYYLWAYMAVIFLATVTYSWIVFDGDVSHERLASKGLSEAPVEFSFLQLAAPVFLLILTRLRMPVSTTFLLLSTFTTDAKTITGILGKSFTGYLIAFVLAIVVWFAVAKLVKAKFKGKPAKWWLPVQWLTSGALWSVWIAQDAANIAVFLPRSLEFWEFAAFATYIVIGLGFLFYFRGDRIQSIVSEKAGVTDLRAATIIDFVYAILLYYFKQLSNIPMSTTWVFIGLLGGRELAIAFSKKRTTRKIKTTKKALRLLGRDMLFALIGLLVSVILALAINREVRMEVWGYFTGN